jgi:GTPase SAR1 family protein
MFEVTINYLRDYLPGYLRVAREVCREDAVYVVVGSKIDPEDQRVIQAEGADFARENSCLYVEVSPRLSQGTTEALETMVREILSRQWRRR